MRCQASRRCFRPTSHGGCPSTSRRSLSDWAQLDDLVIAGDPDHCRACIERYAELGLTDLLLQFAMPTLEPAVIAESQARFMAEVATPATEVHV